MRILDVEQRSESWFTARLGRVTSSVASAMLAKPKSGKGESVGREKLRVRLALEQLTGVSQERAFTPTAAMLNGIEREAAALALYETLTGELVNRVGFLEHDTLMAGASLDGYVGDFERIVEVKSPLAETHLDTLQSRTVPLDYLRQIQHQLWMVPQASGADFVSYCPEFPEGQRLVILPVERAAVDCREYDAQICSFLVEVGGTVAKIRALPKGVA